MIPRTLVAAVAAALLPIGTLAAQLPCFETNLGTNLALADDQALVVPLGFPFPGPGGVTSTTITVSSNGFVWVGNSNDNGCCNGFSFLFLPNAPRIAPLWTNLVPGPATATQGVFFQTLPATATTAQRAVVTWSNVREALTNNVFTVQLQLDANGQITFAYDHRVHAANLWATLIGVTEGNANPGGAATAQTIDFAALSPGSPLLSLTNPTVHEDFAGLGGTDIAGRSFSFTPVQSGYVVEDRTQCTQATVQAYGAGCPLPASVYESFASGPTFDLANTSLLFAPNGQGGWSVVPGPGFTPAGGQTLSLFDDDVSLPLQLGFSFPHAGGATSAIQVASNGFVWLSTGNSDSRCCDGDPVLFHLDPASIAGFWTDLDPESGGTVRAQQDPANQAFHVTWTGVPDFVLGNPQTFQISLFASGAFALSYATMGASGQDVLVGYSPGLSELVAPPVDLITAPLTTGSGGPPLTLGAVGGSRPTIGTTLVLGLSQQPASTVLGVLALGFTELPGISLDSVGLTGCLLHASLDTLSTFTLPSFALPIPNQPSLITLPIFAQGATLSPGVNPVGIATSNGLRLVIGL